MEAQGQEQVQRQELGRTPDTRQQHGNVTALMQKLHRPWEEAQVKQTERLSQIHPQTRLTAAERRHKPKDPKVRA